MNNRFTRITLEIPSITPVVKRLLIINCVIFLIQSIIQNGSTMIQLFGLTPQLVISKYYLWQPATYMFLHGNFTHLFFNMFALWMFGTELEDKWGSTYFLKYYIFIGLGSGLLSFIPPIIFKNMYYTSIIGSSGAIFGLLLAYGLYWPNRTILLMFIIPIKIKWFLVLIGLFSLFAAGLNSHGNIAHFTHLGGLLVGYIYLKYSLHLNNRRYTKFEDYNNKTYFKKNVSNKKPLKEENIYYHSENISNIDQQVDNILDKIVKDGIETLTFEEKQILKKASHLLNTKK